MDGRTRFMVGLGVALAAVSVIVALSGTTDVTESTGLEHQQSARRAGAAPLHERAAHTDLEPGRPARTAPDRGTDRTAPQRAHPEHTEERGRPVLMDAERVRPARTTTGEPGERVEVPEGTNGGWDDPTNERVLGPKEWMAKTDADERARIDEVFEKSRAARYDPRLSNQSRGESVAAVKAVVDACFGALRERTPGVAGRLIVAWTAGASGGVGTITNPRIKTNYRLEDETFEACVLDGAQNLRFPASDGDAIEVEAPFFYDGAF